MSAPLLGSGLAAALAQVGCADGSTAGAPTTRPAPPPAHACWGDTVRAGLPAELPAAALAPCGPALPPCDAWERRAAALQGAGRFLAGWTGDLRFDAAIGAHAVTAVVTSEAWREVAARARARADADPDHPHRAWFDPSAVATGARRVAAAAPPVPRPDAPIAYNAVVTEALYCAVNGWRAATEAYACGPMRDGRWGTTHAAWALQIARDAGCTPASCLPDVDAELVAIALAGRPGADLAELTTTQRADLRAEALTMALRDGVPDDGALGEALDALLDAQQPDGGFGAATDADPPGARYHATMAASWALAEAVRASATATGR